MGLKDIKKKVIFCLEHNYIQHEVGRSGNINEKNYLLTGQVSVEFVAELILTTNGLCFEKRRHHLLPEVDVYIFTPKDWYIKCYFIEPDVFFISVHK